MPLDMLVQTCANFYDATRMKFSQAKKLCLKISDKTDSALSKELVKTKSRMI